MTITNCVVRNHTGNGIKFRPNASSNLSVSNTLVADNGQSGIFVQPSGSSLTVKAEFNRVEAYSNSVHGLTVDGQLGSGSDTSVTVADSVAGNNNSNGFNVSTSASGASVELMMVRSSAVNNKGTGAAVGAGGFATARIYMGSSMLMGNAKGWSAANGAIFLSYGDNDIDLNADGSPAPGTTVRK